ncbi:hypothetical protein SUGI_0465830 [Cryptomeria japonica]|nr:hypothetical protein SUGI_0465830 [Cryptomeria japonica]
MNMDIKGEKRKLEFLCSEKEKVSKRKIKCTVGSDGNGDELEQFFALLDRIQETKKMLDQKCMNDCCTKDKCREEHLYKTAIKNISPWKPSFQWEDFYKGGINNRCPGEKDLVSHTTNHTERSLEIHRQGIGSGDHVRVWSSDEYAVIDLNVEATT